MLAQRRRRWADVVQMLYKCFEFAGQRYMKCKYRTVGFSTRPKVKSETVSGGSRCQTIEIIFPTLFYKTP